MIYAVPFYTMSDGIHVLRVEAENRLEAEELTKRHPRFSQLAESAWPLSQREYLALDVRDLKNFHEATERLRKPLEAE